MSLVDVTRCKECTHRHVCGRKNKYEELISELSMIHNRFRHVIEDGPYDNYCIKSVCNHYNYDSKVK